MEKPPSTIRVAVLGDSYGEAKQVALHETFCAVLERALGKRLEGCGLRAEVLNFSVTGYGTAQELLTLRHKVWNYSPDLVVLTVTTGNDIRNNSRELEPIKRRPFFILRNGDLVLDDGFRLEVPLRRDRNRLLRMLSAAISASRTAQLVYKAKYSLMVRVPVSLLESGEEMIYREPADPLWQVAWQVTERLIAAMSAEVSARGVSFLAITLSNPIQVHPDKGLRQAFAERLQVRDLFYPEQRIRAMARREGFAYLAMAPLLQRYVDEHGVCLHGFENSGRGIGHMNQENHRLTGEAIAEEAWALISRHCGQRSARENSGCPNGIPAWCSWDADGC